jgi:hypothetical protein
LEAKMARVWKMVRTSSAVVLAAVVLAACTSDTTAVAPDGFAETLVSSSFRLTGGSVNVLGLISGIGKNDVTLQGLAFGGYNVQCSKATGEIDPDGQFKLRVASGDAEASPDRRGVAKFGFKKNEEPFAMATQPPLPDATAYCPGNNTNGQWTGHFMDPTDVAPYVPVYRLRDVFLRYSLDDVNWTPVSFTCFVASEDYFFSVSDGHWMTNPETSCSQDLEPRTLPVTDWEFYFNDDEASG